MHRMDMKDSFRHGLIMRAVAGLFGSLVSATACASSPIPLLSCAGLPCTEVSVAGTSTLRLAVDTGNDSSVVSLAAAKAMAIPVRPYVGEDNKPVAGYFMATLKDVRLGEEELGDIDVLVVDLARSIKNGNFPPSDGTLSYTALKGRRLSLDFRNHTIEASKTDSPMACDVTCGVMTYPTFGRRGPPIVATTGFQVNSQPVTVQVDTLYAGTMLIYSTSIERLHLESQAAAKLLRNFPFTDGGVEMVEGQAQTEAFGAAAGQLPAPLFFPTAKVHQPDGMFDGTVGCALFQGHVVTFDFKSNRFWST